MQIAGRRIGNDAPPYFIAELSANHNGDLDRAVAIVRGAAAAGADAVKLQTYTADTMTIDCAREDFTIRGGPWDGETLYALYERAHTPWDWHPVLFEEARKAGIACFSSPFDASAVDFLEELDAPAYKIASFEIIDIPLIERCAATGKPMIMSRGMATLSEIEAAVSAARGAGCRDLMLLHCVSGYPAKVEEANLSTIMHMSEMFGVPVGLSDHTLGSAIPVAACAVGAAAIEKHVTLKDGDGGPDGGFSLSIDDLGGLTAACRAAALSIGRPSYEPTEGERGNRLLRRSLYAVADIAQGERFTHENVRAIRPGYGLAPRHIETVIGSSAARSVARGEPLGWHHVSPSDAV